MNIPRSRKGRSVLAAVSVTTGLVLAVAGCGGSGDDGDSEKDTSATHGSRTTDEGGDKASTPADNGPLAQVKSNDITLTVTAATRDEGGFVTVQGTVTNGTGGIWVGDAWMSDETELKRKNSGSLAGASVVDETGRKRYLVLRDTEGRCLCTKFEGGIDSGKTTDWFAQFPAPPEGTTKVTFQVPTMPPAPIKISDGE